LKDKKNEYNSKLSCEDDNRHVLEDKMHTVAHGHGSWTLQIKTLIVEAGPPPPQTSFEDRCQNNFIS